MNAAAGKAGQILAGTFHVAAIHVVVDPADVAHVRSQTLQLLVATEIITASHVNNTLQLLVASDTITASHVNIT